MFSKGDYMIDSYIKLGIAALFPVIATVIFFFLEKKGAFKKMSFMATQIIIGVVFGIIAIVGTEWGIPLTGAQVNCRDAAPLCAGLFFGAPAGIIAGVIGGLERWIAVAWGVGTFTRVACSLSTAIAGLLAAFLRRYLFDNKRPNWAFAFATGVVTEIFHLSMVLFTNINQMTKAFEVVQACTFPMLIANSASVLVAALVLTALSHDPVFVKKTEVNISQRIQRGLLWAVLVAYVATTLATSLMQSGLAKSNTTTSLTQGIEDMKGAIEEAAGEELLQSTKLIASLLDKNSLTDLAERYDVAEISLVNEDGVITESTNESFVGFDFNTTEQSKPFLVLLDGKTTSFVQEYGPIGKDSTIERKYAGVAIEGGFVQVGYDATGFQRAIRKDILTAAHNRHIGQTGFLVIVNAKGTVVSAPDDLDKQKITGIEVTRENDGVMYEEEVEGVKYCIMHIYAEGYYIYAMLPSDEAYYMRNLMLYINTFLEVLVFALMFIVIYLLIKHTVIASLNKVTKNLSSISEGNLSETVNIRSSKEFSQLSDDINTTVGTLKGYIAEAAARIDAELEFARNIQASALPRIFPAFPKRDDFDIYACMFTAKEVGGDFYDFYMTDNNTLNFLIADVSGKGIPAAMFMMRAKTELKARTEGGDTVNEVFTTGNNALCEGNDAGMFVTAWQASINLETGKALYANAGHNPPLICRDGHFEYLKGRPGFVLAGMEGVNYKVQEFELTPGDIVFTYTDGVTEATDANEALYGEDRLLAILNSQKFTSMQQLCEVVKADVDAFVGEAPQFDDITMVAFEYKGK